MRRRAHVSHVAMLIHAGPCEPMPDQCWPKRPVAPSLARWFSALLATTSTRSVPTCFLSLVEGGGEEGNSRLGVRRGTNSGVPQVVGGGGRNKEEGGEGNSRAGARRGANSWPPLLPRPVNHSQQGYGVPEGTACGDAQRENGHAASHGAN